MKCVKKMLSVVAILFIVSVGIVLPVKADMDVEVYTTGNVQVVINTDGTVNLIYNGVNIQAEINSLSSTLSSLGSSLNGIALRMNTFVTKSQINQTIYQLIGELDAVLGDLYGKTNFLASVIGITSNSSTVVTNLKAGTQTVASYLDSILETLDDVAEDVGVLEDVINGIQEKLDALEAFETQISEQLNATELEIEILDDYAEAQRNLIRSQITTLEEDLEAFVDSKVLELDKKREALRTDILVDLTTLESLVQELETLMQDTMDRQTNAETEICRLQSRVHMCENMISGLTIFSAAIILVMFALVVKRKRKTKKLP